LTDSDGTLPYRDYVRERREQDERSWVFKNTFVAVVLTCGVLATRTGGPDPPPDLSGKRRHSRRRDTSNMWKN